jgi:hypothetical protein
MFQINWKIKIFIYKVLSIFKLNKILYFIQKKITKRSIVDIKELYHYWEYHAKNINKFNSKKILEFGAGKSLEQNIFFNYRFENKIEQTTIDIDNMLDFDLFNHASEKISLLMSKTKKKEINTVYDLKSKYKIQYLAPLAIDKVSFLNLKFDLCVSSNTLEHLPVSEIENILLNLKQMLNKSGIISFAIDYSDHFSHTDSKIGPLNFLKYSNKTWKKYNTNYLFHNRLRHQDYRKLFLKNGYKIIDEIIGTISEKPKVISKEFDQDNEETFALWGLFTATIK